MFNKFNKLNEKLQPHRITILIILAVITVSLLLFWASQAANKTIWDYLEKLIIPIVIGIVAFWYQRMAKKRDEAAKKAAKDRDEEIKEAARERDKEIEKAARERGLEIESDRQRQTTLATYFDRMSDLLIKHNLRESEKGSEARIVAKARTVSALRYLDGKRIAQVIWFLTDSKLGGMKLLRIELPKADLHGVNLREADIQGAYLPEINLQEAFLSKAKLQGANLRDAKLQGAYLWLANLQGARLLRANLQRAHLEGANLQGADLSEALVAAKQLSEASSVKNATMPDGTKYEEWIAKGKPDWSKAKVKRQNKEKEEDSESEDEA